MVVPFRLLSLDLFIAVFETFDKVIKLRDGHLEILPVITLIVCQVVNIKRFIELFLNGPIAIVTSKILNLGASPISVHI